MRGFSGWHWQVWAAIGIIAVLVAGNVVAGVLLNQKTVDGAAAANPLWVMQAAADNKAAAEVEAAEQEKAKEAADIADLERSVQKSMQDYFTDPANDLVSEQIVVAAVSLIKTADTKYEGMATMSAQGGPPRDVVVHVTADERTLLWNTDKGGLLPLFR